MSRAVIVVVGKYPVSPGGKPTIPGKQLLQRRHSIDVGERIKDKGQSFVVRKGSVSLEVQ